MGNVNNYMCEYLGLARYNADFWNGTVFRGKRRVKVWQLERWDREYYKTGDGRRNKSGNVRKDVQMLCKGKKDIILAVEVMGAPDYSLPVRVMEYDVQELDRQIKALNQKRRRRRRNTNPCINRLRKKERLIPIHTIILYCGDEEYDGTANLQELLDTEGMAPEYQSLLQNYQIRVYSLKDLEEENFETSMREIVAIFKRKDSLEAVEKYYLEHKERFREMDELSINLLGALIGLRKLKVFAQEEGGGVDLCKAFEQAKKKGREEGSFHVLCCLVEKGLLKLKDAAAEAGMSEEVFKERMQCSLNTVSTISQ